MAGFPFSEDPEGADFATALRGVERTAYIGEWADTLGEMFEALQEAGFSEDQAFTLTRDASRCTH